MGIFLFFLFVLGLAIGSFLNVVIFRLRSGETLLGRSHCQQCQKTIAFYDNIPLFSYLLLRGRCRSCGKKISSQYVMVEAVTGILFALIGYLFFPGNSLELWAEFVWILGVTSIFLAIGVYDLRYMEVPLSLLVASVVWTVPFLLGLTQWVGGDVFTNRFALSMMGGLLVSLFFFALVYASKEQWMGWGDVWLGGIAGMIVGISLALFMLTLSFGIGAVVGVGAVVLQKKKMKSQLPFAPFIVLGTLLCLLLPKIFPEFMSLFIL